MVTYWRLFIDVVAERSRRIYEGVLMALNDPQWGRRSGGLSQELRLIRGTGGVVAVFAGSPCPVFL